MLLPKLENRDARIARPLLAALGLLAAAGAVAVGYRLLPAPGGFTPSPVVVDPALEPADAVPAAPGALAGCNVLLVTFDTTRADRPGCYGGPAETPNLDRLARGGVLFSKAYAPAPSTLPSHCSILTGLYPLRHGARANSAFRLDASNTTLAEVLEEAGYGTAAFVSAFVLERQFGTGQGFRRFDDDIEAGDDPGDTLAGAQRPADETTARAVEWLRKRAGEPFMAWVHYFDPHFPYAPPDAFAAAHELAYDAEIAFADFHLGRLLDALQQRGVADRTLVVVVGDHGEGLGQHGEPFHSCLIYDSVMHVPMILHGGSRLAGGARIDRPVSLVDVMPTVLSLLGIDAPPDLDGADLTRPVDEARPVYFETLQGLADYGFAPLLGVRAGDWKYIHGPDAELYDVAEDPAETDDVIAAAPRRADAMRAQLEALFGPDLEAAVTASATHSLSTEELARLRSLGYLAGAAGSLARPARRPHPREMMPLLARTNEALAIRQAEGVEAAVEHLRRLVQDHPGFAPAHRQLGQLAYRAGDLEQAEASFAACIELRPAGTDGLLALAGVKMAQREVPDAIALYRQVIERDPKHVRALTSLGRALLRRGDFAEAADAFAAAIELRPDRRALPGLLVEAGVRAGRRDAVVAQLERLLAADPDLQRLRRALATAVATGAGADPARAVAILREGLARSPGDPGLAGDMAELLLAVPGHDPAEAIELLEALCQAGGSATPRHLFTLARAYAAASRFEEALETAGRARTAAFAARNPRIRALAQEIGAAMGEWEQAANGD